jgi:hypothetical protein
MAKSKTKLRQAGGGEKILTGLRELHDAMIGGDTSKLTLHTVEIPDPFLYGPKEFQKENSNV